MDNVFRLFDCTPERLQSPIPGKRAQPPIVAPTLSAPAFQSVDESEPSEVHCGARSTDQHDSEILRAQKESNGLGPASISNEDVAKYTFRAISNSPQDTCPHESFAATPDPFAAVEKIESGKEGRKRTETDGSSSSNASDADDRLHDRAWNINMASVMAWKAGGRAFRAGAARAALQSGGDLDGGARGSRAAEGSLQERLLTLIPVLLFRFAPLLIVLGEVRGGGQPTAARRLRAALVDARRRAPPRARGGARGSSPGGGKLPA
jgi:hypothetical protein